MAKEPPMSAKLIAEFTGTFLLIFTIGCNVLSKSGIWAGTSIACVLMVAIFAFGGVSGANFNPAVSVALGINGNLPWPEVGMYSATQLLAGIIAGFCYFALMGDTFNLAPAKGFSVGAAAACEVLYTFMLCFVVLNVAAVKKGCQPYFGLAIGFVIIAGAYGAGAVSGGCFNPAVAFGIDVSAIAFGNHYLGIGWCLAYTVFELIGAALAAGLFKVVRPEGGAEDEKYSTVSMLVSEFLGAYILVLTVGLNVMAKSPAGAFSIAASLMCMIYALGDVSGGKFNPAVSLAVFISKIKDGEESDHPITRTLGEMGAQIVGGIAAAFTYAGIYGGKAFPLGPGAGYFISQALVAETVFTFVLCLVVLCAAVHVKTPTPFFGLAIGACVTCGGNAIGAISGGSLNPAVSIGIASAATLSHGTGSFANAVAYSLVEFLGAGLAAGVCMATTQAPEVDVDDTKKTDEEAK
jgi:aquaporin Z